MVRITNWSMKPDALVTSYCMFWAFFKRQTCWVRTVKQRKKVSSNILLKTIEIEKKHNYCLFAIIIVKNESKNGTHLFG